MTAVDPAGSPRHETLRAAISAAMVAVQKELYGKGPTRARTYINDCYVFCVMENGLARSEETLLSAGEQRLVREYRLRHQEVSASTYTGVVERITGRRVLGYHSQIVFQPPRTFEIFILDEAPV
jgi:uncharacterized protein YbcI